MIYITLNNKKQF